MAKCCINKDVDAVLFAFTECLCQITEHCRNQEKPLPSNKELLKLFKIAVENYQEALTV